VGAAQLKQRNHREMAEDWYVQAVNEVERAAAVAKDAIDGAVVMLAAAREQRRAGAGMPEIVNGLVEAGGRATRLGASEAFARFEGAMAAYRAQATRALVDEEGLSLSQVGRMVGVSRQMAARLYARAADEGSDSPSG
jgi:hypothetical protein